MFYGNFKDGRRDRFHRVIATLKEIFGSVYADDNLIALQRSAGFRQDPRFAAAMRNQHRSPQDLSLGWRLHTLCWAARQALQLDGDFVECGVLTGFSMGVVCEYTGFGAKERQMYLYDTFEGIPAAYNSENRSNATYERMNREALSILDLARTRFADYDNVHLVPGIVPESFGRACPRRIAFLHIDMNAAASEIAALDKLFPRVVPGGYVILDDYGWTGYRAQKLAEDAWFAAHGHQVLELPTGQGLVIKRP